MTKKPSDLQLIGRLLGYLRGEEKTLLLVLAMLILYGATQAYGPALIGQAIDQYISVDDAAGLSRTMLILLAAYVVGFGAFIGQNRWMGQVAQGVLFKLRGAIFFHLQSLSLGFYDENEAGDLMSRLGNDTDAIGSLFSNSLTQSLGSLFSLFAILIAMLLLNVQLAIATVLILPIMIVATWYFSTRSRDAFRTTRKTLGQLSSDLEQGLGMVREAQSFARTALEIEHFAEDNAANRDANIHAAGITSAFSPTIDVLSTLGTVLVAGYGGWLALNGTISVGVVVAFLTFAQRFFRPVQQIAQLYTQLQSALAASERVFELIDTPPLVAEKADAKILPTVEGAVELTDVTFGYTQEKMILDGINLSVKPGETVALVGETGSGKSTIVNLVGRYYDVNAGTVSIDGNDVQDLSIRSLRSQFSEVPQNSFLFGDTIANNIRYGQPDASMEQVIGAAKAARVHDFIDTMPDSYETMLTSDGSSVSQGQRQLLCIARAILTDPQLLIFDEATANIDTQTEQLVQAAIDELLRGRTAFVIAHRLSTIRHADKICVLGGGGILEQGSHHELMERGGAYAGLIKSQEGL